VLGQVKDPGSYGFKERLTLVQAISLAGGLTAVASRRKVKLIRETANGRETFEIDLRRILDSKQEDLPLEPGDVVFVPESPI
jgi:protein involved in polysaccharide export with SLBB domain